MVKTFSCQYSNYTNLKQFIRQNDLQTYHHLLVQAFIHENDRQLIQQVQRTIKKLLPNSHLIGTTCSETIQNGKRIMDQNMLTITAFEETSIQTVLLEASEFPAIKREKQWSSSDLKAYVFFSTRELTDFDSFHKDLSGGRDVFSAGGVVRSKGNEPMRLFTFDRVTTDGMIIVLFYNRHLMITSYSDSWEQSAFRFRITAAEGNTVKGINGKNPLSFFQNHLKKLFAKGTTPSPSTLPFLIIHTEQKEISQIVHFFQDGTFEMSSPPIPGGEYAFVHPDDPIHHFQPFSNHSVETIFVVSSTWKNEVYPFVTKEKLKRLQRVAPTFGLLSDVHYCFEGGRLSRQLYSFQAIGFSEIRRVQEGEHFSQNSLGEWNLPAYYSDLLSVSTKEYNRLKDRYLTVNQYFNSLFDHNDDFVFSVDLHGRFTRVNQTFISIFGVTEEEIIGKSALDYVKREDLRQVKRYFIKSLKGYEQSYKIDLPITGNQIFQIRNIPIMIHGKPEGIIGFGRNITDKIKFEEKIIQLAYYDKETNLPNRTLIFETVTEKIKKADKNEKLAVMFVDIDRFKIINDSLGHHIGDQVIKDLAYRIRKTIPKDIQLGRFGGDKFTLIFPSSYDSKQILTIGNQLLKVISKPFLHDGQEFFLSASAGVSVYPEDGKDTVFILKNADTAMNRAKKLGGNKVTFFSNEMNNQVKQRFELENYLRRAVEKNELYLYYQPLVDLKTGVINGSEALVRWNHPKLGLISPLHFIPIAEETGVIHEIGNWVLHEACKQNKKWMEEGIGELSISVNVSAVQFQHPHFIDYVKNALKESNLDAKYLHLELTESGMLFNLQQTIETMKKLQNLGVKVSIDDFGTGYSSLSYLKNLPINILKIDRSLIRNIHEKRVDRSIVEAIITMGNGLAVKIVAEGVESFEQIKELKKLNCHYAQGYYIEKPIDAIAFSERIKMKRQMIPSI
ncbi:EAL domain-containing protein [Fervidibacillus albus]|uniref:EAL domain-containing protein n=1 Tax=Fervidibacillus albus TaxID=2980026 RepID=A0A9E8RU07_9BACI|nr:EAL domain-containing protein [Fervidibacillus albus]WAA08685.1 EAL domain-containing protein [Fervidibacillus albus]